MKAYFIASGTNLDEDIDTYRKIISSLDKLGVKLTRNWLESAYKRSKSRPKQEIDIEVTWKDKYRKNIEAISRADIIIAEISRKSFLVGFLVATSLQMKKPILLLSTHDEVESAIGASRSEEIIKFVKYTPDHLNEVISKFIVENNSGAKDVRFNFFIDRKILNYLNWASLKSGDTKSEVIRKLLIKEIDRSNYQ